MEELIRTIELILIETGQHDIDKFRLGETIRYAPYEVAEILRARVDELHNFYVAQNNGMSNFEIPEKCRMCGYYYNFMCRAEQCFKDGIVT